MFEYDNHKFSLSITGLEEIEMGMPNTVTHILSLVDPGTKLPSSIEDIACQFRLVLYLHDALSSDNTRYPPTVIDVKTICQFADNIDFSSQVHLLVHCHMGRSRSSAAAAILLLYLGIESPFSVFKSLQQLRNPIWPNWTFLEHADLVLGYDGTLLKACEELYSNVREQFPKWVEDPIPENISI